MRPFKLLLPAFLLFMLTSCDSTIYVAIRNYREPCKVDVTYQKSGNTFFDKDTLLVKDFNSANFDGLLIRTNTAPNSYSFIAPQQKEIALRPAALNRQPIKQVEVFNAAEAVWTIPLWDIKELKRLQKTGQIKIKRLLFIHSIFIVNK